MEHFRPVLRRSWDDSWSLLFAAPVLTSLLLVAVWALNLFFQYGKQQFMTNAVTAGLGWSLLSTVIVFVALFLVHFCYITPKRMLAEQANKEEQTKEGQEQLRKERDTLLKTNSPDLVAAIECIGTGDWGSGYAFVVIQATIANRGSPSIATDYEIYIHKSGARTRYKPHVFINPNPINVEPTEALFEKTETAIQRGDKVRGFLWTTIPGMTNAQYKAEGCHVEIEFKDINGTTYRCEQNVATSVSSDGSEIFPGTGNPIGAAFKKAKPQESAEDKERRRRTGYAERLAIVMDKGRELVARLRVLDPDNPQPTQEEIDEWWASAYVAFSLQPLSAIYIARFNAAHDPSAEDFQYPEDRTGAYKRINSKLPVLGEFIKELMQPS